MKGKGDAKWRRIRQKNLTSVRSSYILWILKRTLNYDGYVAITEGQAFDLRLKGLCHGSPVHFVEFCQFNTRPQSKLQFSQEGEDDFYHAG